jgi:hypothetical protein
MPCERPWECELEDKSPGSDAHEGSGKPDADTTCDKILSKDLNKIPFAKEEKSDIFCARVKGISVIGRTNIYGPVRKFVINESDSRKR